MSFYEAHFYDASPDGGIAAQLKALAIYSLLYEFQNLPSSVICLFPIVGQLLVFHSRLARKECGIQERFGGQMFLGPKTASLHGLLVSSIRTRAMTSVEN